MWFILLRWWIMQFLQIWLTKLQQKGCQVKLFALTYIHKKCMSISFILNEILLFRVILLPIWPRKMWPQMALLWITRKANELKQAIRGHKRSFWFLKNPWFLMHRASEIPKIWEVLCCNAIYYGANHNLGNSDG